jgi:hypothetical protein
VNSAAPRTLHITSGTAPCKYATISLKIVPQSPFEKGLQDGFCKKSMLQCNGHLAVSERWYMLYALLRCATFAAIGFTYGVFLVAYTIGLLPFSGAGFLGLWIISSPLTCVKYSHCVIYIATPLLWAFICAVLGLSAHKPARWLFLLLMATHFLCMPLRILNIVENRYYFNYPHFDWFIMFRCEATPAKLIVLLSSYLIGQVVMWTVFVRLWRQSAVNNISEPRGRRAWLILPLMPVLAAICYGCLSDEFHRAAKQAQVCQRVDDLGGHVGKFEPPAWWSAFLGKHFLSPVHGIDVHDTAVSDDDLSIFAELKWYRALNLNHTAITDEGIKRILDNTNALSLDGLQITDECMPHIVNMRHLNTLDISNTLITASGLEHLPDQISSLYVAGLHLTDNSMDVIAQREYLDSLDISNNQITDSGIAKLGKYDNVSYLNLSNTLITGSTLRELSRKTYCLFFKLDLGKNAIRGEYLKDLEGISMISLSLGGAPVTDDDLAYLRNVDLMKLEINNTNITGVGLRHLNDLECMNLQALNLSNTRITGDDLADFKQIDRLSELDISGTRLVDDEASFLQELIKVRLLNLANTNITDASLYYLKDLPELAELDIQGTTTTDAGLELIKSFRAAKESESVTLVHKMESNDPPKEITERAPPSLKKVKAKNTRITDEAANAFQREMPGIVLER